MRLLPILIEKQHQFTDEDSLIIRALREHEAGKKTADLARKHGISETTLYNWKANPTTNEAAPLGAFICPRWVPFAGFVSSVLLLVVDLVV